MDGPMNPGILEEYFKLMLQYGVQNLQLEEGTRKVIISGIYKETTPLTEDEISREEAMEALRE